jgi:hypothetical protein
MDDELTESGRRDQPDPETLAGGLRGSRFTNVPRTARPALEAATEAKFKVPHGSCVRF